MQVDTRRIADAYADISLEHANRLSQFEHLQALCLDASTEVADWFLFSDDDDIWHHSSVGKAVEPWKALRKNRYRL